MQTRCHIDEVPLGWLSPTGEFIKVEYGEHTSFALNFCERNGIELDEDDDPEIFLIRHDWVLIHFAEQCGATRRVLVECDFFLTDSQDIFLQNYAFDYQIEINLHHINGKNYL